MTEDRHKADVAPVIYALQQEFNLPDHVAQAAVQMVDRLRAQRENNLIGDSIEHTGAACLYLVGKIHGEAPLPEALAEQTNDDAKYLLRRSRGMATELGLDPSKILDPTQYIDLICDELPVGDNVVQQAKLIISHAQDEGIVSGKNPRGQAAAAVYAATRLQNERRVTQHDISDVIGVSEVTIRNRYTEHLEADPPFYRSEGQPETKTHTGGEPADTRTADEEVAATDEYVEPSAETLTATVDHISDNDEVESRARTLFILAQESPHIEFALSDSIDEWVIAAVCVAAEQVDTGPTNEEKSDLASTVGLSPQQLEGRCYKLRRAWEQQGGR